MAQYCRYCAYLVTGNGIWCWKHEKEMTEQRAKQTNRCKDFVLNREDAFFENEKGYIPRPHVEPIEPLPDQMALF